MREGSIMPHGSSLPDFKNYYMSIEKFEVMRKFNLIEKPKIGPGYRKGIKMGEAKCNNASFSILLPLYIEDILVDKTVAAPFGGNSTIKQLPSFIEDDINDIIKSFCYNQYSRSPEHHKQILDMFTMDVYGTTIHTESLVKKEIYAKKAYSLTMYWVSDGNISMSFGSLYYELMKIRSKIGTILKNYKPKNYRPRKRTIISVNKIIPLWKCGELPF